MTEPGASANEADPLADGGPETGWSAIAFAVLMLAAGVVFLVQALSIRSQAGIWPRGLAALLIAFALAQIFILLRRRRLAGGPAVATPSVRSAGLLESSPVRQAFTALWLAGYCLAAQVFGFGPVMVVMMPLYMWLMGYRRPVAIVLITAGATVAMTYVFDAVAYVPVWRGGL